MPPETTLPEDELSLPIAGPEITASSPTSESAGTGTDKEVSSARALEQGALSSISAGSAGPVQGSLPAASLGALPPSSATSASASNPQFADDGDLIEKEWVEKAKQIVEKTKDDPYVQSREINLVKTDYLKKRYNKDLEVSG